MEGRQRKVQVVLAAISPEGVWSFLVFRTNPERGSFWQNVTGSVEEGETFEEAALREAQEESGLAIEHIVDIEDLNLVHHFLDRWKRKVEEHTFLIVLEGQWKPRLDPHEHVDWKWLEINEVEDNCLEWPSNVEALEKASLLLKRMGA